MTIRIWAHVASILVFVSLLAALSANAGADLAHDVLASAVLALLSVFVQTHGPGVLRQRPQYTPLVFIFAGLLLLPPVLFILIVILPYIVVELHHRLAHHQLPEPYMGRRIFVSHLIASIAAGGLLRVSGVESTDLTSPLAMVVVLAAAACYMFTNQFVAVQTPSLARGAMRWRISPAGRHAMLVDLLQLSLGYVLAIVWRINPWSCVPALLPLVAIYRMLRIPELEQQAQTDGKTGLWNARHFQELAAAELQRSKRFERPVAVLMADLDLLRNINTAYGHLAGDTVLAGVGDIIRQVIRPYDIAARFGGEEFTLALPEATLEQAYELAEKLRRSVAAAEFTVLTSAMPIKATISIGIACFPKDGTTLAELIHKADVAVYQAKIGGRNRVACAAETASAAAHEHLSLDERRFYKLSETPVDYLSQP